MRTLHRGRLLDLLSLLLTDLPDRWHRRRVQNPRTILATLLLLAIERGRGFAEEEGSKNSAAPVRCGEARNGSADCEYERLREQLGNKAPAARA